MKNLKVLLGVVGLTFLASTFIQPKVAYASPGATVSPYITVTPSTVIKKKVGTSANFLTSFMLVGCTIDPLSFATLDGQEATCTIVGATTVDRVIPIPPAGGTSVATAWCGYPVAASITAADTLKFRLQNLSGITCDMAATEYQFLLLRPNLHND